MRDDSNFFAKEPAAASAASRRRQRETLTGTGNIEYWYCAECDKYYADSDGTASLDSVVTAATGHTYVNGVCTVCGVIKTSEGLAYFLFGGETYYGVTGIGECTDTELVIPPTYNGLPVTAIGASAFSNCSDLTRVIIPESVAYIGYEAFSGCDNLTSVTFKDPDNWYVSYGGQIDVSDPETAATYLTDDYCGYYWYKA